jgi:hypothetical protein
MSSSSLVTGAAPLGCMGSSQPGHRTTGKVSSASLPILPPGIKAAQANRCFVALLGAPCGRPPFGTPFEIVLWPLTTTHSGHANFQLVVPGTTFLLSYRIKGLHGAGMGSVSEDEYRRRALECVALSQFAENSEYRVLLLGMAQAWLRLADYAVMFGDTAAVIATQTETDQEK